MKKLFSLFLALVLVLCPVFFTALQSFASSVDSLPGENGTFADFVTEVTVDPTQQKVKRGTSFTFTAEVAGSDPRVTWSIGDKGSSSTQIDQNGRLTVAYDETYQRIKVRASSVLNPEIYAEATVDVVDETPYITSVTVSPSSISLRKGVSYGFDAIVEGTDYHDVTSTMTGATSENTTMDKYGYLKISGDETASTLRVRATSKRDTSKYGEAVVTVLDKGVIPGPALLANYDTTRVGINGTVTGAQVTQALRNALDKENVTEGTYLYYGSTYTGLVKNVMEAGGGRVTYEDLFYSDELLDPSDDYYYYFNIENVQGYIFDPETEYRGKVNGAWADYTVMKSPPEGEVDVFIKAVFGAGSFVMDMKVNPSQQKMKKGTSFTFTAEVAGTDSRVTWSIGDKGSSATQIDQSGRLTVGSDETYQRITVRATSVLNPEIYAEATVDVMDETPYISSVTVSPSSVTLRKGMTYAFEAVVEGTDFHDVSWTLTGAHSESTKIDSYGYLKISGDETAATLRVRATSKRDTSRYGEAVVTVVDKDVISDPVILVNYDTTMVGLNETLTGAQVTQALRNALDKENVTEGTYLYYGSTYTGLVKNLTELGNGRVTYEGLFYDDEPLNPADEYYYYFNVENVQGYIFDPEIEYRGKVNGEWADYTIVKSPPEGEIDVFIKAEFASVNEYIDRIDLTGPKPRVGDDVDDYSDSSLFGTNGDERYGVYGLNWAVNVDGVYQSFEGERFQAGVQYYIWFYLETHDDCLFNYGPEGQPVLEYTYNMRPVEPIEVDLDSYHTGLEFFIPITATDPSSDVDVIPYPSSIGSGVSVDGREVTVELGYGCKLGYFSGSKYEAIRPIGYSSGIWTFIVPDGIDEVILVVCGDANGDGRLSNADATKIKSMLKAGEDFAFLWDFAADANFDGKCSNADATKIKSALKTDQYIY